MWLSDTEGLKFMSKPDDMDMNDNNNEEEAQDHRLMSRPSICVMVHTCRLLRKSVIFVANQAQEHYTMLPTFYRYGFLWPSRISFKPDGNFLSCQILCMMSIWQIVTSKPSWPTVNGKWCVECEASCLIMIFYSHTATVSSWSASMEFGKDFTHQYLFLLIIPRSSNVLELSCNWHSLLHQGSII